MGPGVRGAHMAVAVGSVVGACELDVGCSFTGVSGLVLVCFWVFAELLANDDSCLHAVSPTSGA